MRDSYWLQPLATEAELNPIVRHLFKEFYGIELPATIDLAETTLDSLYDDLAARITGSEPGVTLAKVDRPRIDLIHDQAKRRLDRYRRTCPCLGQGRPQFPGHGLQLRPGQLPPAGAGDLPPRRSAPHPRTCAKSCRTSPPRETTRSLPDEQDVPTAEKEKQFYLIREEADGNPYNWDFDLCRVTLGNFRYRKMTLVRDYAELVSDGFQNPAFDSIFSLVPRPVELEAPKAPPLEERMHIVSCDPTQAAAIGLARTGTSYIVQGPPGTGKSQTITNLIADYVMRGQEGAVCLREAGRHRRGLRTPATARPAPTLLPDS